MTRGRRIILFIISLALLFLIILGVKERLYSVAEPSIVILASLVMISFTTLFLEHFFTTPTDVLASTIAILLLLSPLHGTLDRLGVWYWLFYGYNSLLLITSLTALLLLQETSSSTAIRNRVSSYLKRFSTFFGNGRFLFFSLFFVTLLFYIDSQSSEFLLLFGYATVILLVDPKRFILNIFSIERKHNLDIGEIIGVQSKNTFLARLFKERAPVHRYDLVEFHYSMAEDRPLFKGMIVDNYLLNEQQWIKILSTEEFRQALGEEASNAITKNNIVYKVENKEAPEFLNRFVGVVIEDTTIKKLRFEYGAKTLVFEGNLLELKVGNQKVLYQVVEGLTDVEKLESKNEAGFIIGEAIQLGVWDSNRHSFDRYGWVPDINTPVFLASQAEAVTPGSGELQIGTIPGTNYPMLMNMSDAITHHLAILGVTGCGKSVFARDLLRNIMGDDLRVICVDFTNEYKDKFADLSINSVVSEGNQEVLFEAIDVLELELSKFKNQQTPAVITGCENSLREKFHDSIKTFLESDTQIALFELPDVSNTTGILDYTKWFFKVLFEIAKYNNCFGKRVCIVLEEAHTVIPEWTFVGVDDKEARKLVNSIGQIALQGRKYNVGFIVIAQRTANVSKTILTQCNSIIAFQQFDKTGSDFLANYMGTDMVGALPNLQFRQAIAVGKGFTSGVPIIFEVPEIDETANAPPQ